MSSEAFAVVRQGERRGAEKRERTVKRLNSQGYNDANIALRLKMNPASVARIRYRLGLEAAGRKIARQGSWSPQQAHELHAEGLIDRQIAKVLGVSRETISRWRRQAGLRRNGKPGPKNETVKGPSASNSTKGN